MPVKVPVKIKDQRSPAVATTHEGPSAKTFSLISDAKLKQLYTTMLRCRILDERLGQLHKQRKWPGKYLSSSGREAAAVGAAIDLRRGDWIMPASRDAITSFIKGVSLDAILTRLLSAKGSLFAASAIPNIVPPAVGFTAQTGFAAGVAFAARAGQSGSVAMAFWASASSLPLPAPEAWYDTLRFAAVQCLPLVLVVHGELPAVDFPPKKRDHRTNTGISTRICDVPVIPVDGNDVVAVYRVSHESVHKARYGGGPTLIEARTLTPATDNGKIPVLSSDPILKMEDYLTSKGLFSATWKQRIADSFYRELDAALAATE